MKSLGIRNLLLLASSLFTLSVSGQISTEKRKWFNASIDILGPATNGHLYFLKGEHYAICDKEGKALTPFIYSSIYRVSDSLYSVKTASGFQLLGFSLTPKVAGTFDTIRRMQENWEFIELVGKKSSLYMHEETGQVSKVRPPEVEDPIMVATEVPWQENEWDAEREIMWHPLTTLRNQSDILEIQEKGKGKRVRYVLYARGNKIGTYAHEPILFHDLYLVKEGFYSSQLFHCDNSVPLATEIYSIEVADGNLLCVGYGDRNPGRYMVFTADGKMVNESIQKHPKYFKYAYQGMDFCFTVGENEDGKFLMDCEGNVVHSNPDREYRFYGNFAEIDDPYSRWDMRGSYIDLLEKKPIEFEGILDNHFMYQSLEGRIKVYDKNRWREFEGIHFLTYNVLAVTDTLSCIYSLKTGQLIQSKQTHLKPVYFHPDNRVYLREGAYWHLYDFLSDKVLSSSRYAEICPDYTSKYHVVLTEGGKVALVSPTGKEFFE